MNNKKLYDALYSIMEKLKSCKRDESITQLDHLMQEVKIDMEKEKNPYSSKKRLIACSNYAKKLEKMRPVFGYTINYNNKQVYTDGYFMVSLSKDDEVLIPDVTTNKDVNALKIDSIIQNFKQVYNYNYKLNINDFLNWYKINKDNQPYKIQVDDGVICFDKNNLKHFIEFMNFKSDETITFYYNSNWGIQYCKKDNETEGIILSLRN